MKSRSALVVLVGLFVLFEVYAARAQQSVKIGFVSTFSGPTAVIGKDMRDAVELALSHLDNKMGGLRVEVVYEDDQQKPDIGKLRTDKLIQSENVNFVAGYIWSNVLLASYKSVIEAETFLVSANAGPSQIAGELCSPWFYSTSWQNDQPPQAIGEYMNQKGIKTAFLIGPNYAAGKDILSGVRSTFKGSIVGEEYTVWPTQLDFSAELAKARAAKPEAIFAFYPGAAGVQFLNQYAQSGLRGQIPLYTVFTVDELSLPLQKDAALDIPGVLPWVNDLDNPANKKFVEDYRQKFGRTPTFYAAQSYDAIMLINSAVASVKGDLKNKEGMRAEMKRANYASVRGTYRYGNNNFPIQNFYVQQAAKQSDGTLGLKTLATVVKDNQDKFHDRCALK